MREGQERRIHCHSPPICVYPPAKHIYLNVVDLDLEEIALRDERYPLERPDVQRRVEPPQDEGPSRAAEADANEER